MLVNGKAPGRDEQSPQSKSEYRGSTTESEKYHDTKLFRFPVDQQQENVANLSTSAVVKSEHTSLMGDILNSRFF